MNVNCSDRDGPGDDPTKRSTSDRETQCTSLRRQLTFIQTHDIFQTETDPVSENKLMVTKGSGRGRDNQEVGIAGTVTERLL